MRLRRLPDRSIEFSQLSFWELKTLRSVPGLADPTGVPGAKERLFPDPVVKADADPEQLADWREYIVPDLADLFRSSLDVISGDVQTAAETEFIEEPRRKGGRSRGAAKADEAEEESEDEDDSSDLDELEDFLKDDDGEADDDNDEDEDEDGEDNESSDQPGPRRTAWRFLVPAENIDHWYRGVNQARLVMSQRFGIDSEHGISAEQILSTGNFERYLQYEMLTALAGWLVAYIMED